jgi:hypothetical protein
MRFWRGHPFVADGPMCYNIRYSTVSNIVLTRLPVGIIHLCILRDKPSTIVGTFPFWGRLVMPPLHAPVVAARAAAFKAALRGARRGGSRLVGALWWWPQERRLSKPPYVVSTRVGVVLSVPRGGGCKSGGFQSRPTWCPPGWESSCRCLVVVAARAVAFKAALRGARRGGGRLVGALWWWPQERRLSKPPYVVPAGVGVVLPAHYGVD